MTLAIYLLVWFMSMAALLLVAMQPNRPIRLFWGILASLSAACSFLYHHISRNELTVFDVLSLWSARHESSRALDEYLSISIVSGVLFVISILVILFFPAGRRLSGRGWTAVACCAPLLPIALIAGITYLKNGGGTQAMPKQFSNLSIVAVAAANLATQDIPQREKVQVAPKTPPKINHVVMLIDESVRPDYLDWTPENPYTPFLASARERIANFGAAGSGGNCSHYTNAILRFAASRARLVNSVQRNPTIWQYAKRAGFRTVYIDGQAAMVKNNPGFFQNFMTIAEATYIDKVVRISDVSLEQADFKLLDAIKDELSQGQPTFIYANKNGAHFPYDTSYPKSEAVFQPTIASTMSVSESKDNEGGDTAARINSYRNAIRWSVDGFFERFFDEIELDDVAVFYTSDHGQNLMPGQLKYCSIKTPDPREGLVPMLAFSGRPDLQARFEIAATMNAGSTTHFALTPTVLDLFGYPQEHILAKIGPTLFDKIVEPVAFTSGDIFGIFSSELHWTPIDTSANFLEAYPSPGDPPQAQASPPGQER